MRSHKERTRDLWNTRCETQIQTKLDQPHRQNGQHQTPETPSPTNPGEEGIADAPGNDDNASMQERVKLPNPWRKMMMMMMMMI